MNPESSASSWTGAAPSSPSQRGSCDRRPVESTTRSASSSSPDRVRTPVHVRDSAVRARSQTDHLGPSANCEARLVLGRCCENVLERRTSSRQRDGTLVAVPRLAIRDRGGHAGRADRCAPAPAATKRVADVGQVRVERPAHACLEEGAAGETCTTPRRSQLVQASSTESGTETRRARAPTPHDRRARAASPRPDRTRHRLGRRSSSASAILPRALGGASPSYETRPGTW